MKELMRVLGHPILGELKPAKRIQITIDGRKIQGFDGEPIVATLLANGICLCRRTEYKREPRFLFCGIGQCTDCVMIVDGVPNVRTCITPVREGMKVETQIGAGRWGRKY